jgi:hypothetical protein
MSLPDTTTDALSSAPGTSKIHIPTECQRTDDFRSTAPELVRQEEDVSAGYYKGVTWSSIPHLQGVPSGKGASKSFVYRYGWRMLRPDTSPIQYFWVCTSCHKQRNHRKHDYNITNGTDSAITHLLSHHNIDKDGPRKRPRSIADQVSGQPSSSRLSSSSIGYDIGQYGTVFDEASWKGAVTALIVNENLAFRLLESPYMQNCLTMLNPAVESRGCLPYHGTLRRWISQVYYSHVGIVTEQLRLATSAIHFSFDLWTSRNLRALCGINCHFADEYGNLKTFLLALPQQEGKHTGANIAETVAEIITRFDLQNNIGFFNADNASNNDTCIAALANEFNFDPIERRLRCAGHIFNLVARALLWGIDEDVFLRELAAVDITTVELELWRGRGPIGKVRNTIVYIRSSPQRNEAFKKAQRDHPLLKKVCELHTFNDTRWNSVFDALRVFIHVRPAIDDFYHTTLRDWQDYENEKTDFGSKPRPEKMRKKPTVLNDFITQDDWVILTRYYEILEPIWQFTQRLEGHGAGASHGIIWQVIPAMERLLGHFERLKKQYIIVEPIQDYSVVPLTGSQIPASQSAMVSQLLSQASQPPSLTPTNNDHTPPSRPSRANKRAKKNKTTPMAPPPPRSPSPSPPPPTYTPSGEPIEQTMEYRMLATGVNLAWKKLEQYYQITDQSPVYVAAVVLHPAYTWRWIRAKWKGRQDWITFSQQAVRQFWLDNYAQIAVDIPGGDESTYATSWMDADITSEEEEANIESPETDEYAKWCIEGRVPDVYHPLEFWSKPRIKHNYPRLSRMARDLFTIPAMSDEPERVFSSCGNMVTAQRGNLSAEAIEEAQCMKNWMRNGVITNLGATFEAVSSRPEDVPIC